MSNAKNRMANTDPRENKKRAWKIALNPRDYSKSERKLLIHRGFQAYMENGQVNQREILSDVSQLVANVLDRQSRDEIVSNPPEYVDAPGQMVLLMSLGSLLVRQHDLFENDPRKPRIHKDIREHYLHLVYAAAEHAEHSDTIWVTLGELVYGRDQEDDYGPPAGRTIEGITTLDGAEGSYYKVPLTHANRKCEARVGNDRNGKLKALIKGPYVYIPVDDVHEKYEEDYFTGHNGVAHLLEQTVKLSFDEDLLEEYQERLTGINDRLEELNKNGHDDRLFKQRRYPAKLEAILMAVEAVDEDIAKLGEPLTADDIYNALQEYATKTDVKWVRNIADNLHSPSSVAGTLSSFANEEDLSHVTIQNRSGKPDLYELEYKVGNFKQIDVTEIEDLLELPCMENLHESLLQSKPVRWELYSFVRYLFEINEVEFTVEDIKEWFSQYDWYDADITEYQVNYEREQQMADGNRPLPISCSNDNRAWAEHCIGKENCEYSLYQSVELKPDVYTRTGDS